jgi:CAAX protease family protein
MDTNLLPYFFLLITVVICWASSFLIGMIALALSTLVGLVLHRVEPMGLVWIVLAGITIWIASTPAFPRWRRWTAMGIFLFMGVALSNHLLPGFNNLEVFDKIQFSSDSAPFTMYLNFDKTVVGIFIYLFVLKKRELVAWQKKGKRPTIHVCDIIVADDMFAL